MTHTQARIEELERNAREICIYCDDVDVAPAVKDEEDGWWIHPEDDCLDAATECLAPGTRDRIAELRAEASQVVQAANANDNQKPTVNYHNLPMPGRVLIDAEGTAVPPSQTDVKWDFLFVRDDEWTLGVPRELMETALKLWPDKWNDIYCLTAFTNPPQPVREITDE